MPPIVVLVNSFSKDFCAERIKNRRFFIIEREGDKGIVGWGIIGGESEGGKEGGREKGLRGRENQNRV